MPTSDEGRRAYWKNKTVWTFSVLAIVIAVLAGLCIYGWRVSERSANWTADHLRWVDRQDWPQELSKVDDPVAVLSKLDEGWVSKGSEAQGCFRNGPGRPYQTIWLIVPGTPNQILRYDLVEPRPERPDGH